MDNRRTAVTIIGIISVIVLLTAGIATTAQADAPKREAAVTGLTVTAGDEPGDLAITWNPHPKSNVEDYRVTWAPADSNFRSWRNTDWNAFPDGASHTVTGLTAAGEYKVKVRARFPNGKGSDWSEVVTGNAAPAPALLPTITPPEPEPALESLEATGEENDNQLRSNHLVAPTNFRVTNGTLTNGVYVMDNYDDKPELDWDLPSGGRGSRLTRQWIDTDNTCDNDCPPLLLLETHGTRHTGYTDWYIAPEKHIYRVRAMAMDTNNDMWNPGVAAEITVQLPAAPPYVPTAPTNFRMTGESRGNTTGLRMSWDRDSEAPAFLVQWRNADQEFNAAASGGRSNIYAESGPNVWGADGTDRSFAISAHYQKDGINSNTTYYARVGKCKTDECVIADVAFSSVRSVTT